MSATSVTIRGGTPRRRSTRRARWTTSTRSPSPSFSDLDDLERQIRLAQDVLPFSPIETFADVQAVASVADTIAQSPGAPIAVLLSDAWNAPPADATISSVE